MALSATMAKNNSNSLDEQMDLFFDEKKWS